MSGRPISDYGMLSDRHSAALVSLDGSVDWLCFPRFDSPAVFGRILGDEAGHWSIHPVAPTTVKRAYLHGSLVLETVFTVDDGEVTLTDALVLGASGDPHRLGEGAPHTLAREVTCTRGEVAIEVELVPRPEFGLVVPLLSHVDGGLLVRGGATWMHLSTPLELEIKDGAAFTRVIVHHGQTIRFALRWASLGTRINGKWDQEEIGERIVLTTSAWQEWSRTHQNYRGPWEELVSRSGRVLHGLGYQPTGAIVAAPTTSLPETVGGTRNWDYRYTWVRDAAFTMDALWVAACPDEGQNFFDFVTTAAASTRSLQIMYGVGGEHDLSERELPHLPGWRDSRPVRVGNGAWRQHQLDVYGELLATAARYSDQLPAEDRALCDFLVWLADTTARVWRRPDHGIWEIRGEPRHFLHSKLMCWVALDRALTLTGLLGVPEEKAEAWRRERDEIRAAIEESGFSERAGAYTQSFGSDELDASALMVAIVGFDSGERAKATVDAIAAGLTDSLGLVHRYRAESNVDGIAEPEGAFLLCTFWLARAYAMTGRVPQAKEAFERAIAHVNDLGLLSEQVDPVSGEALGNFPQAFSHVGLINAAYAIAEASGDPP